MAGNEVNIELGDKMSELFYEASKLTRKNRPGLLDLEADSFEGTALVRGEYFGANLRDIRFGHELDGIGTKPEISERVEEHRGSASDLFAMVGDDVSVRGGEILTIDTVLDVRFLDEDVDVIARGMRQLAEGMVQAAEKSRVVVTTGEIAELGSRIGGYGEFNYNWSGSAFYAVNRERMLTGKELQEGDKLVGFVEPGFRSNGITDVRNAMLEAYGDQWHDHIELPLGFVTLGKLVQTPSTIYAGLMTDLLGGFRLEVNPKANITGAAHITGGGQPSKLGRMLKRSPGLGIRIDNPITPPKIMTHVQSLRGFDDKKAYGKWHMGPGMVVATTEPEKVIAEAQKHGIESQVIGEVTDESGVIRIRNKGAVQSEEWLVYGE